MLYKYTGNEYWYAIKIYIETLQIANRMMDFVFEDFKQNRSISDKNLGDLKQKLDQTLRYVYLLQMQTQLYIVTYDVRSSRSPNYSEVMDLLKGKNNASIEDIQSKTREIENMTDAQKRELQRSIRQMLGE